MSPLVEEIYMERMNALKNSTVESVEEMKMELHERINKLEAFGNELQEAYPNKYYANWVNNEINEFSQTLTKLIDSLHINQDSIEDFWHIQAEEYNLWGKWELIDFKNDVYYVPMYGDEVTAQQFFNLDEPLNI